MLWSERTGIPTEESRMCTMAAFKIISSLFNVIVPPGYNFFCRTILDALKGNGVARLHERKPLGNGDRSGVDAVGAVIGQCEIVAGVTGNDDLHDAKESS